MEVDPRSAFDWAEYEAWLDGELGMDDANIELLEIGAIQEA